jgi:hypothetical protein
MIVPAVAEKVALLAPAATVTEAGTLRTVLLSDRATAVPPWGCHLAQRDRACANCAGCQTRSARDNNVFARLCDVAWRSRISVQSDWAVYNIGTVRPVRRESFGSDATEPTRAIGDPSRRPKGGIGAMLTFHSNGVVDFSSQFGSPQCKAGPEV